MAGKKKQLATWRVKWILLYMLVSLLYIAGFIYTLSLEFYGKAIVIIYEIIIIAMGMIISIGSWIIHKKRKKAEKTKNAK